MELEPEMEQPLVEILVRLQTKYFPVFLFTPFLSQILAIFQLLFL
jgi:hypothetical protein